MFTKSAHLYDLLYGFKDYAAESEMIMNLVPREAPRAETVLDVACGTAEHDRYLTCRYQVDGMDLDSQFVDIAAEKNPHGNYFLADMIDFSLGRSYDVVMCLFSSIGYVRTLENVVKALVCFKRHLNPRGIILVEPWFAPDVWQERLIHMLSAETENLKVCRMNTSSREGNISILNFHYLVGSVGKIEYLTERHELGLFTINQMLSAFADAGLDVRHHPQGLTGRGLYIARNPGNQNSD